MKFHGYTEFRARGADFDRAVEGTPEIARFCSRSLWQTAAFECLDSGREDGEPLILEHEGTWLVFVERPGTRIFYPLEAAWMFGCPLVGEPEKAVRLLCEIAGERVIGPIGFCVGGVLEGGRLHRSLSELREEALQWEEMPGTDCMGIDLSGGVEAWLERRSPKFRKTLRQIRVPDEVERIDGSALPPGEILGRILGVQRRTYKWRKGGDIFQSGGFTSFYRRIIEELSAEGRLRFSFARHRGCDVAYQLGGVVGDTYRGLQMSYAEEVRSWGIGNWLQLANLRDCAAAGVAHYHLGMHAPYKERWADHRDRYRIVFVVL